MRISALFSILFLCFALISCGDDEEETTCATAMDCPDGFTCINSVCQPQSGDNGTSDGDNSGNTGLSVDDETSDSDSDAAEVPDEVQGCPNACSGFGKCDFETKTCTCTQNHAGEDCSVCADGYHEESEDPELDEDGDPNVRSCVYNVTCNPNPCNGGKCTEQGNTVKCTCSNHAAGTFCDACEEGYLKSANTGECKPDCEHGVTCTAPQKCGIDYTSNEAACQDPCDNPHYSGDDCKSCDVNYFCSGHGTACIVEGGTEKCTCESGYMGAKCENKSCTETQCFKEWTCIVPIIEYEYSEPGHCNISTCQCDPGWRTATAGENSSVVCGPNLEMRNNVLCSICDIDNPPTDLDTPGCETECGSGFCDDNNAASLGFLTGKCYIEPGTHKVACQCFMYGIPANDLLMSGNGSKYKDENPTGLCAESSSSGD